MTPNDKRLIEVAFPLKQVSLDSVHEKNVRHGHISTLHIWPARRPLAASRAALIATLLPDPGDRETRNAILERMAGRVVEKIERKRVNGRVVEKTKEETLGGILHWKRENGPDLNWFREEIHKAYGGRAPRVLDPFAGGGAIPLEAMRLGCEVTAMDINPVAWFILKCTLEYPQKLAGQTRPLPDFALEDAEFMEAFLKAKGFKGAGLRTFLERLGHGDHASEIQLNALARDDAILEANLAWHVRAWGRWVLARARKELASYYPTYAEFEPLAPGKNFEPRPMRLLEIDNDGVAQLEPLNAGFDAAYLKDPRNPRWIAKPTVAYLWARTVTCKQCRATLPLLKTRWLCKKDRKRVLLTMDLPAGSTACLPDRQAHAGVVFGVQSDVPHNGGNAAQRREHDKRIGAGTMSRTGATCPCCGAIMTMADIRFEGRAGRLGATMTAVVVDGPKGKGKEYRTPSDLELKAVYHAEQREPGVMSKLVGHSLNEPFDPASTRSISAHLYGVRHWLDLYTSRQRLSLGTLGLCMHSVAAMIASTDLSETWRNAVLDALCLGLDRLICFMCVNTRWKTDADSMTDSFSRFSISLLWDFAEANPIGTAVGGYLRCNERIATAYAKLFSTLRNPGITDTLQQSAGEFVSTAKYDLVITDPPYYQAVSYSDLSDFFYTWLRGFVSRELPQFEAQLTEKSREVVQHIRGDKSREDEKTKYESLMAGAIRNARSCLTDDGRFVCVFAHKDPDAWETLVSVIIRSGFIVTGSWPIQTEMPARQRGAGVAALASSVWLVCRPRPEIIRPGWDNAVLNEMHENITQQLRDFWDAGIRGPDFVWAATGPALEAFSKHPVVKKANDPNQLMTVSEFLREVRRMVVDFVVGRVLTQDDGQEALSACGHAQAGATGLDDVTTYYLLHRHDFGMQEAPVGGCILYALSCNLSDTALVKQHDLLAQSGRGGASDELEEDLSAQAGDTPADAGETGGGAKVKLKPWNRRRGRNLGLEAPGGRPVPLIDQVHKLMHLWRAGDQVKVDDYLDTRGLQRNALFNQILQALIELADTGSDERSILEALSNHVAVRGDVGAPRQRRFQFGEKNRP